MSVPPSQTTPINEVGVFRAALQVVRGRIISGLFAALPLVLTIIIVQKLYDLVRGVLAPVIVWVQAFLDARRLRFDFLEQYLAPFIAVVIVLSFLYLLGLFVRTRLMLAVDAVLARVPVVGTIFKAISNVFQSLSKQLQGQHGFKRVVLVSFPHPGIKSLAFVTNTLQDSTTGRTILCVCLLTGVMPPNGFTLFVPEEEVVDIKWSVNQTLQAILSGGITSPTTVHYDRGPASPTVPVSRD